jgi:TfoX/Sxy family transcriptional regulator of competence genes
MDGTVLAAGVMVQLADNVHFLGLFGSLGIINDKIAFAAVFSA